MASSPLTCTQLPPPATPPTHVVLSHTCTAGHCEASISSQDPVCPTPGGTVASSSASPSTSTPASHGQPTRPSQGRAPGLLAFRVDSEERSADPTDDHGSDLLSWLCSDDHVSTPRSSDPSLSDQPASPSSPCADDDDPAPARPHTHPRRHRPQVVSTSEDEGPEDSHPPRRRLVRTREATRPAGPPPNHWCRRLRPK